MNCFLVEAEQLCSPDLRVQLERRNPEEGGWSLRLLALESSLDLLIESQRIPTRPCGEEIGEFDCGKFLKIL